jgi:hypothetical protein
MSVSSWKDLGQSPIRDNLLLAEVAAWLHDMGKCADEHIINQASDRPQGYSYSYKTAQSHRLPSGLPDVCLMNETISVKDLIEQGMPRVIRDASKPWLLRVLGRCHSVAHVEKELPDGETSTKQPKNNTRLSTAFGLEGNPVTGLTNILSRLPFNSMQSRATFVPQVERAFDAALGDTRRPINEVTLADWSGAVAALYKSALAGALLGIKPTNPDHLHWRLLRVNFDVLGLYAKAVKIGDLLGYKRAVEQACEAVKKLIEEEYPLGNEIYRDSTGIYFIFPDLDLPADLAQEIRRRVEETEMELAPRIDVTVGDGKTAAEQLKGILAKARREALQDLARPFDGQNLGDYWHQRWKKVGDGKWEVCPVCRLRPKREDRDICEICKKRRASRIKEWGQNPEQTIWIDEIADHNDRVALIVGKFGLDDWLSGDLVQTMLVKAVSGNPKDCVPKNPSPARLRRVWKTCQRFWTETVVEEILTSHPYGQGTPDSSLRRARWRVVPDQTTGWEEHGPYDGTVDGRPISLFWRAQFGDFITIINLQLSGALQRGQRVTVSDPDNPRRIWSFTVQEATPSDDEFGTYQPFLVLLASPDQFLALVPAIDALEIAERIRAEYVRQFGKVQNRLPLFLGLIFFPRKTPLTAVMEAARRMLNTPFKEERWTIQKVTNNTIEFANDVEWNVPVVMGDNVTEDLWYPYFFLETQGNPGRQYCFQLRREGDTDPQKVGSVSAKYADRWLVHVRDLRQGDGVQVTPSRFAYLFLESTARRFRFDPEKDGMLLDELPRLRKMWQDLKESGITNTALNGLWALLERKRAAWGAESKELEKLAEDALKDAGLFQRKDPQGNPPRDLVRPDDVRNGRFVRCLELHMYILKRTCLASGGYEVSHTGGGNRGGSRAGAVRTDIR